MKNRSSTSVLSRELRIIKGSSQQLVKFRPSSDNVEEFDGDIEDFDACLWMQRFERSLFKLKLHKKAKAAKYFGTLMVDDAFHWYESQPRATQKSFPALKKAFLERYDFSNNDVRSVVEKLGDFERHVAPKLSAKDTQMTSSWWAWLDHLNDLADQVQDHEVAPLILADKAWNALPRLLQKELGEAPKTVSQLVEACTDLSAESYDRIQEEDEERRQSEDKLTSLQEEVESLKRLAQEKLGTLYPHKKPQGGALKKAGSPL